MKKLLIKKILFLIIFLTNTEHATAEEIIKDEKELYIKQLTEAENNKKNEYKTIKALIPIFSAILLSEIYNYCINNYGKVSEPSEENTPKKTEKNIFEKIEGQISESNFGSYLKYCYNAIRFEDSISLTLNNSRLTQVCKDELTKSFLLLEQTEGTLFVDTFLTTLGTRKTYSAVKKAWRNCVKKVNNCVNSAVPIILLLCAAAYTQLQISEMFSNEIKNKLSQVEFFNNHSHLNKLTATSASAIFNTLIISPILGNLFIYGIELCKEMASDQHPVIKKGKCAKLCSEYIKSTDSKELEENKEIYEAAKSLFIKLSFINKIINNAIKFA